MFFMKLSGRLYTTNTMVSLSQPTTHIDLDTEEWRDPKNRILFIPNRLAVVSSLRAANIAANALKLNSGSDVFKEFLRSEDTIVNTEKSSNHFFIRDGGIYSYAINKDDTNKIDIVKSPNTPLYLYSDEPGIRKYLYVAAIHLFEINEYDRITRNLIKLESLITKHFDNKKKLEHYKRRRELLRVILYKRLDKIAELILRLYNEISIEKITKLKVISLFDLDQPIGKLDMYDIYPNKDEEWDYSNVKKRHLENVIKQQTAQLAIRETFLSEDKQVSKPKRTKKKSGESKT